MPFFWNDSCLFFAEEVFDLRNETAGFFRGVTGHIAQLPGNAFHDVTKLARIQIDAKQFLDQAERIRGKLCDQVLVAGQFANQIRDDFLDIHKRTSHYTVFLSDHQSRTGFVKDIIEQ